MSFLGAKKVVRTYSRQRKHSLYDEEPPTKRRRVEKTVELSEPHTTGAAISKLQSTRSSPARDSSTFPPSSPKESIAIFSDEAPQPTPPSSPLPQASSPPLRRRRPVFSFLKRRSRPEPLEEPLSERSHNVPSPPKHPPKKRRLVQMQLDLVAELSRTCKVCGMGYVPSHAEDAALHRKFHAMNVGGVDITKALSEKLKQNQVWAGGDRSFIVVVSRRDTLALRNKASEVLKVVNTELGAAPILDEALWSQIRNPIAAITRLQGDRRQKVQHSKTGKAEYAASDRFKVYLYIQGQKCVGACLAERIKGAFPVLDQDNASARTGLVPADTDSSSISIGKAIEPAILGVSRIWTSNLHRKQGIAMRMLDSARSDFLYGMTIDKAEVAFSQPTESGGNLARRWFGRRAGWHVYVD